MWKLQKFTAKGLLNPNLHPVKQNFLYFTGLKFGLFAIKSDNGRNNGHNILSVESKIRYIGVHLIEASLHIQNTFALAFHKQTEYSEPLI